MGITTESKPQHIRKVKPNITNSTNPKGYDKMNWKQMMKMDKAINTHFTNAHWGKMIELSIYDALLVRDVMDNIKMKQSKNNEPCEHEWKVSGHSNGCGGDWIEIECEYCDADPTDDEIDALLDDYNDY